MDIYQVRPTAIGWELEDQQTQKKRLVRSPLRC